MCFAQRGFGRPIDRPRPLAENSGRISRYSRSATALRQSQKRLSACDTIAECPREDAPADMRGVFRTIRVNGVTHKRSARKGPRSRRPACPRLDWKCARVFRAPDIGRTRLRLQKERPKSTDKLRTPCMGFSLSRTNCSEHAFFLSPNPHVSRCTRSAGVYSWHGQPALLGRAERSTLKARRGSRRSCGARG
jgi:hypothetical protein